MCVYVLHNNKKTKKVCLTNFYYILLILNLVCESVYICIKYIMYILYILYIDNWIYHQTYLSSNIAYSAEVLIGNNQHGDKYFGICQTEFKTRLGNHKNSFKNRQKEKDTELSKYIWNLKDKNITNYIIKLSIVKQTSGYNRVTNSYNLCLSEKLVICNFRGKDH